MKSAFDWRIDFNEWSRLAATDPRLFEERRSDLVNRVIECTSPPRQQRLRCLQWRIDKTREVSANPLAACIKLSALMWDSVTGPGGLHETLHRFTRANSLPAHAPRHNAVILAFRRPVPG
jgi:hypothetical protein